MRLSEQLHEALTEWKKTGEGYELKTSMGLAKLYKKGKQWMLAMGDEEVSLGRRASFDHAEGILKELGAKPLTEATAEKVQLMPGQLVTVKTRQGKKLATGRIVEVDEAIGTVRVTDDSTGADLQVDVDPERYEIWVKPPPDTDQVRLGRIKTLYVRPSMPGVYMGGRWR
jgi:hypothetical protein